MNIEDLKKITDLALTNADQTVRFAKKSEDPSLNLLQAYGALCFANSILRNERLNMLLNDRFEEVEKIDEMSELLDKKAKDIWGR